MKKKRFTEQQIIGFLMEAGVAVAMLASQTPHMKCRLPQHGQAVPCGGLAVCGHQAAPDSSTGWASNHARIRCSLPDAYRRDGPADAGFPAPVQLAVIACNRVLPGRIQ